MLKGKGATTPESAASTGPATGSDNVPPGPPSTASPEVHPSGNGADKQTAPPVVEPASVLPPLVEISKRERGRPSDEEQARERGISVAEVKRQRKDRIRNPEPPGTVSTDLVQKAQVNYHVTATVLVDSTTGFCEQFLGPEWKANATERDNLTGATETYLRAKNIPDLPPGILLAFVISAYALPRLNSPTMREKLGRIGDRIRARFKGY